MSSATVTDDTKIVGQETKNLKKTLCVLLVTTFLLVGSIFGVSVATTRLTKVFTVDPITGFATATGTQQVVKTELAIYRNLPFSLVTMDNEALAHINAVTLKDGDIQFLTFGHARDSTNNLVTLIVQGGTITFDEIGIQSATGDPAILLEESGVLDSGTGRRSLSSEDDGFGFDATPHPIPCLPGLPDWVRCTGPVL